MLREGGEPTGALIGPLVLLAMVYSRKKRRGKLDNIVILLVLVVSLSLSLAVCVGTPAPGSLPQPTNQNEGPPTPIHIKLTTTSEGGAIIEYESSGKVLDTTPVAAGTPLAKIIAIACATPSTTGTPTPRPTGTPTPTPTGTQPPPLAKDYHIEFTESGTTWDYDDELVAMDAVIAVSTKLADVLGGSPLSAWLSTYGEMTFQMGGCNDCLGTTHSGHTSGAHKIEFAGISDNSPKGRNLIVHELGHAFKWVLYNKTGNKIDVAVELGNWRTSHPNYPDRQTFNGPSGAIGPNYGFASAQNVIIWQQSLDGSDSEEFADQFLGWTFNMWERNALGILTDDGKARADMMDANMPMWVRRAAGD
jgi:hypothetical protein